MKKEKKLLLISLIPFLVFALFLTYAYFDGSPYWMIYGLWNDGRWFLWILLVAYAGLVKYFLVYSKVSKKTKKTLALLAFAPIAVIIVHAVINSMVGMEKPILNPLIILIALAGKYSPKMIYGVEAMFYTVLLDVFECFHYPVFQVCLIYQIMYMIYIEHKKER